MGTLKRTYALPAGTLEQFEKAVKPGKRSAVIAEAIQDWVDRRRRERLRREVVEGCREMAEVYLEIEREYHPLEEEVTRALDTRSQTRRDRARSSRSRGRV